MHNNPLRRSCGPRVYKFTLAILISMTLIALSCRQPQSSILTPSISATTQLSLSASTAFSSKRETTSQSISGEIYEQAREENLSQDVSEVPLLSVKLLNYLAQHNRKTLLCDGQTYELLINKYFPKVYTLGSQEYLVEQVCVLGAYNVAYSYFLYRPHTPIDEVDMSHQPLEAYLRDEEGYFLLIGSSDKSAELNIPDGEITPLKFEKYQLNDLGEPVSYTSYIVGGRRLYDASERILSIFSKNRGMADCGSFAHYQLVGSHFELLEYRYQACCSSQQECEESSYKRHPEEYPKIYP